MKKIILFLLVLGLVTSVVEAKSKVPTAVRTSFSSKYPTATALRWDKEGANYEAMFKLKGVKNSVVFDGKGNVLQSEVTIPITQLSTTITDYIKAHYPKRKIKRAARITTPQMVTTYEVELPGKDVIFSDKGAFLREEKD